MRRLVLTSSALAAALACAGCGSSGGGGGLSVTIPKAHPYELAGFSPAGPVAAHQAVPMSFRIQLPSGKTLTSYRRGAGPHTGVHLIVVRDDLSLIIHQHPPLSAAGTAKTRVTFPSPGRYRVLVDAYPSASGVPRNFQLSRPVTVRGSWKPKPLGTPPLVQKVDGYRIALARPPRIRVADPAFLRITITDPSGKPATPQAWFGATAHAIFFKAKTLDYFHTHVCTPELTACTGSVGGAPVGSSQQPGVLRVGVLMPASGTWRLFLQCRVNGHVLTIPYTLHVTT